MMNAPMPTTWIEVTLRNVCEPTATWNPQRERRDEFWYVDVSAVSRDSYAIREPQRVKGSQAPSRARKIVQAGDAIFATVRPRLRRVALIGEEFDRQIASTAFCVIRANREKAVPHFLYYLLLTDFLNEEIAKFESGASYPAVNDKDVLDRLIWLPPKPEQEKIAAVLWKVQRAIEVEGKLVATARELKQVALRQLFTRGLHGEPRKETEIGTVPQTWEIRRLGEECEVLNGYAFESKDYVASGVTNFRVVNIRDEGRIELERDVKFLPDSFVEKYSSYLLRPLDILLVMVGATRGKLCIIKGEHLPALMNQNMWRIVPRSEAVDKMFLYYYLNLLIPHYMAKHSQESRGFFKKEELREELLLLPGLDEQRLIARTMQVIDDKIVVHERKRAVLQELFRTLLHQLMTGRIRVADLDVDTSEVTQF